MRSFVDTSAAIKLYRLEPNSAAVKAHISANDTLLICRLTPTEFRSACFGMVRQNTASLAAAQTYIKAFESDLPKFILLNFDDATLARVDTLLDIYAITDGLRPLDAIQLASALEEHAREPLDAFITTDVVLAKVATASGLIVLP